MLSPHKAEIKKEILMKGPKGIASFLLFLPVTRRNNETTAPIMKDNNIFKAIFFNPSIKPNIAISFISPPPIPPLDTNAIIVNSNPADIKPMILSDKGMDIPYIKQTETLYKTAIKINNPNSLSGII